MWVKQGFISQGIKQKKRWIVWFFIEPWIKSLTEKLIITENKYKKDILPSSFYGNNH